MLLVFPCLCISELHLDVEGATQVVQRRQVEARVLCPQRLGLALGVREGHRLQQRVAQGTKEGV